MSVTTVTKTTGLASVVSVSVRMEYEVDDEDGKDGKTENEERNERKGKKIKDNDHTIYERTNGTTRLEWQ